MAKSTSSTNPDKNSELELILQRADEQWNAGNLRSAFRLFLVAAKAGDIGAQVNLGNFYSDGIGVKPNRTSALYWYRRAYRRGYGAAAYNIAVMFRNESKLRQALAWFVRAAQLKDVDANLEIAKIHLQKNDRRKAIRFLKQVCHAKQLEVTEASRQEAQDLLEGLV